MIIIIVLIAAVAIICVLFGDEKKEEHIDSLPEHQAKILKPSTLTPGKGYMNKARQNNQGGNKNGSQNGKNS